MLVGVTDVVEQLGAGKRQYSDQQNVVGRSACPRLQLSKEFLGQDTVAAHTEEQTSCSQRPRESAAECRDDQDYTHRVKQERAADPLADVHKRGFEVRKCAPVGPYARAQIGFKRTAYARENTG